MRPSVLRAEGTLRLESRAASRDFETFRTRDSGLATRDCQMPTGIAEIDAVTGGLPRGALTELVGATASGKTSLLLSFIAAATARDEAVALVDASDAFDPRSAAATGVDLDRLLWVRCKSPEHALKTADYLIQGGGFGLVAIDLSDIPNHWMRRVPLAFWFRFRRAVEKTPTILVLLERETTVKTCASLVLRTERKSTGWRGTLFEGMELEVEVAEKRRLQASGHRPQARARIHTACRL